MSNAADHDVRRLILAGKGHLVLSYNGALCMNHSALLGLDLEI